MQHFTTVKDVSDPKKLVEKALSVKKTPFAWKHLGENKTIGLIFFNSSLRTRLSTQKAAQNLGMNVIVMNIGTEGWKLEFEDGAVMNVDKAEHIKDAAAVMGAYVDILGIRAFAELTDREADYREEVISAFQAYAGVPIISLESATLHPLQSLADWITIQEYQQKPRPKVVLTWAPHPRALPQAVGNSFVEWMNQADVDLVVTHPEGYELAPEIMQGVAVEYDQNKAFAGADFIYAKNWSAYNDYGKILSQDADWTVSANKMALTNDARFMHCLPVRRNVIVDDAVIDSPNSLVIPQAANRVVSAQTVIMELLQHSIK
ncbi:MAG: N-acetylornithine carbamoyltransferase [Bacteroidia bacterium]